MKQASQGPTFRGGPLDSGTTAGTAASLALSSLPHTPLGTQPKYGRSYWWTPQLAPDARCGWQNLRRARGTRSEARWKAHSLLLSTIYYVLWTMAGTMYIVVGQFGKKPCDARSIIISPFSGFFQTSGTQKNHEISPSLLRAFPRFVTDLRSCARLDSGRQMQAPPLAGRQASFITRELLCCSVCHGTPQDAPSASGQPRVRIHCKSL